MRRNWEKLIQKISFEDKEKYYQDLPLKPGFWFWKILATCDFDISELKFDIPETFVVVGNNNFVWLTNDHNTKSI